MTPLNARLVDSGQVDGDAPEPEFLDGFCANPRCDVRIQHSTGPGRRAKYHDPGCKREAEKMQRRLEGRLKHFAAQVEMVQRQLSAYADVDADEATTFSAGADADRHAAQVALARAEAIVELLDEPGNRAADELERLVLAVGPALK